MSRQLRDEVDAAFRQANLGEDLEAEAKAREERDREQARAAFFKELRVSAEGGVTCDRCGSPNLYAPYKPDKEGIYNYVSLRCRKCQYQKKQVIRIQRTTDGQWFVLEWLDGKGVRYLERPWSR